MFYKSLPKNASMPNFTGFNNDFFLVSFSAVLKNDELVALKRKYFLLSLNKWLSTSQEGLL